MKRNSLKLIIGVTVTILLIVAGLYYYVIIYRSSLYNAAEIDISNVEVLPQSSSGGGGGGSLRP